MNSFSRTTPLAGAGQSSHKTICIFLLIAAGLEFAFSLNMAIRSFFVFQKSEAGWFIGGLLFAGLDQMYGSRFWSSVNLFSIFILPVPAAAALWFSLRGKLRASIAMLAVFWLFAWITSSFPYSLTHGIRGGAALISSVVTPIIAFIALFLVWRDRYLVWIAIFLGLVTAYDLAGKAYMEYLIRTF